MSGRVFPLNGLIDGYHDDLVRLAFDLAVCNGRFDMREAAYLKQWLSFENVSD